MIYLIIGIPIFIIAWYEIKRIPKAKRDTYERVSKALVKDVVTTETQEAVDLIEEMLEDKYKQGFDDGILVQKWWNKVEVKK